MLNFRLKLFHWQREALLTNLKKAEHLGHIQSVKKILVILALADEMAKEQIGQLFKISAESVRLW